MIATVISTGCELYRCFIPMRRLVPSGVLRAVRGLYLYATKGVR